ncbi:unnamed protein product [Amoebophrya sp. A120]|nr:unnamed protein product [Amoebophrya sp. A120]|eukprot:GSA120T00001456001.1
MIIKNYTPSRWSPGLVARTMFVVAFEVPIVLGVLFSRVAALSVSSAGAASKSNHVGVLQIKNVYFYKTKLTEYEESAQLIEKLTARDMALHLSPLRYRTGIQQKKDGLGKSQSEKWYASRANGCYRYIWKAQTVTVLPAVEARGSTLPSVVTLWFLVELLMDGHHYDHITGSAERRWKLALPQALTKVLEAHHQQPQPLETLAAAIHEGSAGFTLFDGQQLRQLREQPMRSAGRRRGNEQPVARWQRQEPVIQEEQEVQILNRHLAIFEADRAFQEAVLGPEGTSVGRSGKIPLHKRITFISGPPGSGKSVQLLALLTKIEAEVPEAVGKGQVVLQYHTQSERLRQDIETRLQKHYAVVPESFSGSDNSSDGEQKADGTTSNEAMLVKPLQGHGISVQPGPLKLSALSPKQEEGLLDAVEKQPLHDYQGAEEYRNSWGSRGLLDLYQMTAAICFDLDLFAQEEDGGLRGPRKKCKKRIKSSFSRKVNNMAAHLGDNFASHLAGAFLAFSFWRNSAQKTAPGPLTRWSKAYEGDSSFATNLRRILKGAQMAYIAIDEAQNLSPMALARYLDFARRHPTLRLVFAFDQNQQLLGGLNDKRLFVSEMVKRDLYSRNKETGSDSASQRVIWETQLPGVWRSPSRLVPVLQVIATMRKRLTSPRTGGAGPDQKFRSAYEGREDVEGSTNSDGPVIVALELNKGQTSFADIKKQFEDGPQPSEGESGARRRAGGTGVLRNAQRTKGMTVRKGSRILKHKKKAGGARVSQRRRVTVRRERKRTVFGRAASSDEGEPASANISSTNAKVDTLDSMPWIYLDEDGAKNWDSDATSLSALQAQGQEWPVVVVADPHEILSSRNDGPAAVRERADGLAKLFVALSRATERVLILTKNAARLQQALALALSVGTQDFAVARSAAQLREILKKTRRSARTWVSSFAEYLANEQTQEQAKASFVKHLLDGEGGAAGERPAHWSKKFRAFGDRSLDCIVARMLRDKASWHFAESPQDAAWKVFRDLVAEQDEAKRIEDESWSWVAEAGEAASFIGLQRDETFKQSNLASEEPVGEGDGGRPGPASGPPGGQGPDGGNAGDEAAAARETAPVEFSEGQIVTIHGLLSKPEFNGRLGQLGLFSTLKDRWQVRLTSAAGGQEPPILLKPDNISAVSVYIDPEIPAAHTHCKWVREFFAQTLELQKTWSAGANLLQAKNIGPILEILQKVFESRLMAYKADGYTSINYPTPLLHPARKCFPRLEPKSKEIQKALLLSKQARTKAQEQGSGQLGVQFRGPSVEDSIRFLELLRKEMEEKPQELRKEQKDKYGEGREDADEIDTGLRDFFHKEFQRLREIAILEMVHLNDPRQSEAYPPEASEPIQAVRLSGLQGSPELDGKIGLLRSFNAKRGQWVVEMISEGGQKVEAFFRPENIEIITDSTNFREVEQATEEPEQPAQKAKQAGRRGAAQQERPAVADRSVPKEREDGKCRAQGKAKGKRGPRSRNGERPPPAATESSRNGELPQRRVCKDGPKLKGSLGTIQERGCAVTINLGGAPVTGRKALLMLGFDV